MRSRVEYGDDRNGHVNYVKGANTAGFVKVAAAMIANAFWDEVAIGGGR